jgi:formate hydrogenlyase subunit 4
MANVYLNLALHLVLLLVVPPFLLGVINRVKAIAAGRRGPPLLQLYYDLAKLFRKGLVLSTTTTWMFIAGPIVTLAALLIAGLLVPQGPLTAPVAFTGDLILFAYLLALGRFFTTAAALDTGSAFEGMGAAREVTFAVLAEPAFFFALLALAKISGSLSLNTMLRGPLENAQHLPGLAAPLVLIAIGLAIVMLAETCRIPVDDPNTHLELTMIHEVMVLDHSGPLFGLVLYGAAVKLFLLATVLLHIVVPFNSDYLWLNLALYLAELVAVAAAIGVVESVMARLQMRHVPYLLIAAVLFCGFGFALLVR